MRIANKLDIKKWDIGNYYTISSQENKAITKLKFLIKK